MFRIVHPGFWIRILIFTHPGSRGQKGTGPRIRIRNTAVKHFSNLTPLKWNTKQHKRILNYTPSPHLAWGADGRTRPGIPSCDGSRPPRRAGWAGCCWTHPRPPPPSPFTPLLGITINLQKIINSSVADPKWLYRIPDPDFYPSRISDPGSKNSNEWVKWKKN